MNEVLKESIKNYQKRTILAIDLKCFYAFVECVDRNLDPFTTPLVVCDTTRGNGTIILAVSPYLKSLGIPSRLRKYDFDKYKIPNCIYAMPRMEHYIKKSCDVIKIYLNYVKYEDLHIYSIDEALLDITNYLKGRGLTDIEFGKAIINEVYQKTKLVVCGGIGENLFMAKACMDLDGKKQKDFIAKWTIDDIKEKLWPISPLSKMWSIGINMERRLNKLGLYKVGDIANYNPFILKKVFGIKGEELYLHANGYDFSIISNKVEQDPKSFSIGQTLFFDADYNQTITNIFLMGEELATRLIKKGMYIQSLGVYLGSSNEDLPSFSNSLVTPCVQTTSEIHALLKQLLKCCPKKLSIRSLYIVGGNLTKGKYIQTTLFGDEEKKKKEKALDLAMIDIRNKFGSTSVIKCSALLEKSTYIARQNQIGGHHK